MKLFQIYNEVHKFGLGSYLKFAIAYGGTATRHQSGNIAVIFPQTIDFSSTINKFCFTYRKDVMFWLQRLAD